MAYYARAKDLNAEELSNDAIRLAKELKAVEKIIRLYGKSRNWEDWIQENHAQIVEVYQKEVQGRLLNDLNFFLDVDAQFDKKEKKIIREFVQSGIKAITKLFVAVSADVISVRRDRDLSELYTNAEGIADMVKNVSEKIWNMYYPIYNRYHNEY